MGNRSRIPFITLSNSDPLPLYDQVKEGVRAAVLRGELAPGDAMPSFRNLAADLRVSLITVKRAYDDLSAEGVLFTRPGRGTFIAETAREACIEAGKRRVRELLEEAVSRARSIGMSETELLTILKNFTP
jgi:GntR family transcriptional regulator